MTALPVIDAEYTIVEIAPAKRPGRSIERRRADKATAPIIVGLLVGVPILIWRFYYG